MTTDGTLDRRGTMLMAIYLGLVSIILSLVIVWIWPASKDGGDHSTVNAQTQWWRLDMSRETSLLFLAALAGALGSNIHGMKSFIDYAGNRQLHVSWVWFYLLMPLVGAQLALLFYCVVRGGFLTAGTSGDGISAFGIAAFTGLVGLFSDQATLKLKEVFTTLFRAEDRRTGKLQNPAPHILTCSPASIEAGHGDTELTIKGNNFVRDSIVRSNGSAQSTKFISPGTLIASCSADELITPRTIHVTVFNPEPAGGLSNSVEFTVRPKSP